MLRANTMPSANNAALQQGKGRFHGVCVDVAVNVNLEAVADRLVLSLLTEMPRCAAIYVEIVRHQHVHVVGDVFADVLFERPSLNILSVEESQFALPLTNSDYDFFVGCSASSLSVSLAANIGFVHLNDTAKPLAVSLDHRGADSVAEIPSGFVGLDSERTLNLTGRHSFFGFAEKERSKEPSNERQMRVVENGVHGHAELVLA